MQNFTKLMLAAGLACVGSRAAQAQQLYDDFESTRAVSYPTVQGTLDQAAANPAKDATNGSTTCGAYTRDGEQYAVLVVKPNSAKMADVAAYGSGTKKMSVLFYSPATGTKVTAVLQNSTKSNSQPYPKGKYLGDFNATTTKANAWEMLTFAVPSGAVADQDYDTGTTSKEIDQLVLLVAPGTDDKSLYYFDNLMGPELTAATTPPPGGGSAVATVQLYDDYEGTRVLKYNKKYTGGTIALDAANPHSDATNSSAHVLHYTRSDAQYDVLFLNTTVAPLADITPFENGSKKFTMKVYSATPGDVFQVTLQDSVVSLASNYPAGRKSEYKATTTATNAWETLTFTKANNPDNSVPNTGINQLVLLINPGKTVAGEFFIDDWTGPSLTNYSPTAVRNQTTTAELVSLYPNPARGVAHVPFTLKHGATVSLSVYDALGRRVAQPLESQVRAAGSHVVDVNTSRLSPGLYTCRLVVDGVSLSRQLSVE